MMTSGAMLPHAVERRCVDCGGTFTTDNLNRVACRHCAGARRPPKPKPADPRGAAELAAQVAALLDRVTKLETKSDAVERELTAMVRRQASAHAERKALRKRVRSLERIESQYMLPSTEAALKQVLNAVAAAFGMSPATICHPTRVKRVSRVRQAYYLLASERTGCTLQQIAKVVNRTDHNTVLTGIARGQRLATTDADFAMRLGRARLERGRDA